MVRSQSHGVHGVRRKEGGSAPMARSQSLEGATTRSPPHSWMGTGHSNLRTARSPLDRFVGTLEVASTSEKDEAAARQVKENFRRRQQNSPHERILHSLINPKFDFDLDDTALNGILSAADQIFFGGELGERVAWGWSNDKSHPRYGSEIVGHTFFRQSSTEADGIETFIELSTPILKESRYSRRLLISAFLHELIHCYLFIRCGMDDARRCSGHTKGFRDIAGVIDAWAGPDILHLRDMEADLERFLKYREPPPVVFLRPRSITTTSTSTTTTTTITTTSALDTKTAGPNPPAAAAAYERDFCCPALRRDDTWEQQQTQLRSHVQDHYHNHRWDIPLDHGHGPGPGHSLSFPGTHYANTF